MISSMVVVVMVTVTPLSPVKPSDPGNSPKRQKCCSQGDILL